LKGETRKAQFVGRSFLVCSHHLIEIDEIRRGDAGGGGRVSTGRGGTGVFQPCRNATEGTRAQAFPINITFLFASSAEK